MFTFKQHQWFLWLVFGRFQVSGFEDRMIQIMTFFCVLERSLLCSQKLHLFDQKYSKNSNIVKYYYNLKQQFSILIYFKW